MIYLFGNYRALGELGTIDNESQERGWGGRGVGLRDLTLPPTLVLVCAVMPVYVYVCLFLRICYTQRVHQRLILILT